MTREEKENLLREAEFSSWVEDLIDNNRCEVLDKIRAEIADLDDADYDYEGYYKAVTDAVQIIDKYKAERGEE